MKKWQAGALFVLVISGALLLLRGNDGEVREATLADGRQVMVRRVSFGKEHRLVDGALWKRALASVSTNVVSLLGVQTRTRSSREEFLMVWIEWGVATNRPPGPQWLRVIDSHGLASYSEMACSSLNRSNGSVLMGFHLRSFPRREQFLRLELNAYRTPNAFEKVAEFIVRNPSYRADVPVQARPRSVAEVHGERFELVALNTGLHATGTVAHMSLTNQWTELVFRIGSNEPARLSTNLLLRGDWSIKSVELRDAFGNVVHERSPQGRIIPLGQQYMMRLDDGIALVRGAVWLETPWMVKAEFQRVATDNLDAAHRWSAQIPVPVESESLELKERGEIEGSAIELVRVERGKDSRIALTMRLRTARAHEWNVIAVRDDRGSNVVRRFSGPKKERLELRVAPEAKQLHIDFGLTHPVTVEWVAPASLLRTNVARWAK
jgi:hypothetical protein